MQHGTLGMELAGSRPDPIFHWTQETAFWFPMEGENLPVAIRESNCCGARQAGKDFIPWLGPEDSTKSKENLPGRPIFSAALPLLLLPLLRASDLGPTLLCDLMATGYGQGARRHVHSDA